jgi:hypothetical protein
VQGIREWRWQERNVHALQGGLQLQEPAKLRANPSRGDARHSEPPGFNRKSSHAHHFPQLSRAVATAPIHLNGFVPAWPAVARI